MFAIPAPALTSLIQAAAAAALGLANERSFEHRKAPACSIAQRLPTPTIP